MQRIRQVLQEAGVDRIDIELIPASLEDVFIASVSRDSEA